MVLKKRKAHFAPVNSVTAWVCVDASVNAVPYSVHACVYATSSRKEDVKDRRRRRRPRRRPGRPRRRRRRRRSRMVCQDKCRETSKYHTQGRKVEKYKSRKCTLNKSYIKMNRKKMRKK